ncbi:MAG TPA: helix-turn-helix transcriptional regulator [Rudaea sp.]|nr:helix-turn-helix transcriptional regulator [Rudaea sp.]
MKVSSPAVDERLELASRIRSARRAAKLSQTALAEQVGVTPSAAAQWEHPHGTSPGLQRLQAIASATGVTFQWLAVGSGERRRRQVQIEDSVPALRLDVFAQDSTEETLLQRFRALSPRGRQLLSAFLEELRLGRR